MEKIRLDKEREEVRWSAGERQAEMDQVTRYHDQLNDLGDMLRKEQEEVNTLTALLQSREQEADAVTQQNAKLLKELRGCQSELQDLQETHGRLQTTHVRLERDLKQKEEQLERVTEEKEKALANATRLKGEVVELQDAVDSRARELAETKRQHQDTTTRLQNLQERLKESPKATETPSPVRHSVVDVKPPRPDLTPKSSAASPIARVLKFRDAKSGLLVAGVLCLCTFSYFFSAGGDQEQLVQRNLQLGQVNFRQREELDSCHKSVNILTERLAKCSAGPKPSAGEEADK
uniref:Uncharacterized protein n=1 Tax=Eutreptiella gymnastica TaxID=73025 RepID=A0A7S4CZ00_9EUGL